MSNEYHVLYQPPTLSAKKLGREREGLAKALVESGKLRIRDNSQVNFVNKSGSDYDQSFSYRELTDPKLQDATRQRISQLIPGGEGEAGIIRYRQMLIDKLKPIRNVAEERELEVARLLVQACEPEVMRQLLDEGCEVFVSTSINVADLMAVHFWENHGLSSGLQSVSGDGTAVYVSSGGNPFITEKEHRTYTTDGLPALARFMTIAGQELGHFADIKRGGPMHARHSASRGQLRASKVAKAARDADIARINEIQRFLRKAGVTFFAKLDKQSRFLKDKRRGAVGYGVFGIVWLLSQIWLRGVGRLRSPLLGIFPRKLHHEYDEGLASLMLRCVQDMQDNLTPKASVYQRTNPLETEAIACIEAVARVPQQVNKWGRAVTRFCWPHLYSFYYDVIIEDLKRIQKENPPRN